MYTAQRGRSFDGFIRHSHTFNRKQKRLQDAQRHLKQFDEDPKLEIMNGRYGPYIAYDGKNYRIPKQCTTRPLNLRMRNVKTL